MDRQPLPLQSHMIESLACERISLVALIEDLHTVILTKADPSVILEELDALARFAERKSAQEKSASRSGRKSFPRAQWSEHQTFLARLNVFRREFASEPNAFDQGQLYDFLSEWLIDALYED